MLPRAAFHDHHKNVLAVDDVPVGVLVAVEEHGVKIPYFDFISSLRCPECNDALRRITARIDLDRIQKFLDGVPELQPLQREFYLTMLTERKEKILDYSMGLLLREEQQPGAPELTM